MSILYLLSAVMILTAFILIKKSEKEIDIIGFICISIVTLFCYNMFICYILTFFMIPNTLLILSVINICISLILIFLIIRNKQIQKFSFQKIDIVYVTVLTIVVLAVSYLNFGLPFSVNYETGDPSVHYLTAIKFAKEETLMPNAEHDQVYGDLSVRKAVSYVNSGILMKCFCEDYASIQCYYVFASFGIFTLFLIAIIMYSALKKYATKKEHTFFAFLVSLICVLGYPLNSFLFGFEYLTMGILILCTIIDLIYYYEKELLKFSYILVVLGLLNFGLFCSYYMFIPFTYSALWIYFCIKNYKKTKKLITKELILLLLTTLLIPFALGYIYHLAPKIYGVIINQSEDINTALDYSEYIINSGFAVNGYIYVNLYSNMILLLPLTIYFFVEKAKNKKLKESILFFLITFCMLFIEILLIGNCFGKVSIYYLSKNYFALWIMLAFTNYKALILIYEKNKHISRLFIYTYIFLMIFYTMVSNVKVEYYIRNPHENILSVMEIFGANKTILLNKPKEYTQSEIEILEYVKNNLDLSDSKIEFVTDENAYYWQYVLLNYINKEDKFIGKAGGQRELTTKWVYLENKIKKVDYIVYFNKSERYKKMENKLFEDSEIIYENESGGILKYNK